MLQVSGRQAAEIAEISRMLDSWVSVHACKTVEDVVQNMTAYDCFQYAVEDILRAI
jgi:hypothetical protein